MCNTRCCVVLANMSAHALLHSVQWALTVCLKQNVPGIAFVSWTALSGGLRWRQAKRIAHAGHTSSASAGHAVGSATNAARELVRAASGNSEQPAVVAALLGVSANCFFQQAVLLAWDVHQLWQSGALQKWWKDQLYGAPRRYVPSVLSRARTRPTCRHDSASGSQCMLAMRKTLCFENSS